MQKNIKYFFLLGIVLLASCKDVVKYEDAKLPSVFAPLKKIPLNLDKGYTINPLTNAPILPKINQNGDTIVTGKVIKIKPQIVDSFFFSKFKKITIKPRLDFVNKSLNQFQFDTVFNGKIDPKNISVIKIDHKARYFHKNKKDSVITGVPIKIEYKTIPITQPKPQIRFKLEKSLTKDVVLEKLIDIETNKSVHIGRVAKDSKGNYWLATLEGLIKFDGTLTTVFNMENGLPTNLLEDISIDKNDVIWISFMEGGLGYFDGKNLKTTKLNLLSITPRSFIHSKDGSVYFKYDLFNENCFSKIKEGYITHFTTNEGLPKDNVYTMIDDFVIDDKNVVWSSSTETITKYDGKFITNYSIIDYNLKDQFGKIDEGRRGIIKDLRHNKNDILFISGRKYINILSGDGQLLVLRLKDHNGQIDNMNIDSENTMWFSFNNNLLSVNNTSIRKYTDDELNLKDGLLEKMTFIDNEVWWYTSYHIDQTPNIIHIQKLKQFNYSDNFFDKNANESLNTWVFTSNKFKCRISREELEITRNDTIFTYQWSALTSQNSNQIGGMITDSAGSLFLVLNKNFVRFDGNNFFINQDENKDKNFMIQSLAFDVNGDLWEKNTNGIFKHTKQFSYSFNKALNDEETWGAIYSDPKGGIWFSNNNQKLYSYINDSSLINYSDKEGLFQINSILYFDNKGRKWFCDLNKIFVMDDKYIRVLGLDQGFNFLFCYKMIENKNGNIILFADNGAILLNNSIDKDLIGHLALFSNYSNVRVSIDDAFFSLDNSFYIRNLQNDRFLLDIDDFKPELNKVNLYFSWLEINGRLLDTRIPFDNKIQLTQQKKKDEFPSSIQLPYYLNHLEIHFSDKTKSEFETKYYSYFLEGSDTSWSTPSKNSFADLRNLDYGEYKFAVISSKDGVNWSSPTVLTITIDKPWWHTIWFRSIIVLIILLVFYLIFKWRTRQLVAKQIQLEKIVENRTDELKKEKELVEEKHKEITDSINYAERIQRSLLASTDLLTENLNDYFIFFQPKDVVSGDFYWASKLSNKKFALLTADSTGHGVPGAIMSFLNISCVEKAVEAEKLIEPSEILNYTRTKIIDTLKKDGSTEGGKDGMDCSLICFDFVNSKFSYAAANNAVWVVRNSKHIELLYDKMPVGKHDKDSTPFTKHEFIIQKGDMVYAITDGLADQFGGPNGKKFMYKQLKELLVSVSNEPMEKQKQKLEDALNNWRGNLEQIDDITIIGVRI